MKKIFWRVFVSFSIVLLVFTVLIGLMFTRFNRTNILGAYKKQLGDLADGVASRTTTAVENGESDTFFDYIAAVDDFGNMQNIDIWIVPNPNVSKPLDEDYTNVDMSQINILEATQNILNTAYDGKRSNYADYDAIYQSEMLHLAVPIRNIGGTVIGAVVVTGPVEMHQNTIIQYQKYMVICVAVGLLMAVFLSVFFSKMLVGPIIQIKESALILAAGEYAHKTEIRRKDELGQLADSMNTLSERLVEAEEYREAIEQNRRDFFSNVSHELRTPIAVVKGYVDTLSDDMVQDEAKKKEYMARIQRECTSMEKLVSDLLVLSRMQNPDYELNVEVMNVIAVAQDAMRSIRILMGEKGLRGTVDFDDPCSLIEGDYDRIRQMFVILLQNAVKYADRDTEIRVYIQRKEHTIITEVTDYGIVIPSEERENIFEKFYRASNHGANEGSGLGLMVAKNIVERHGGTISVKSDVENGTCFQVIFTETSENIT